MVSCTCEGVQGLRDVTRLNYGVLFHEVSQLQFARDFWINTFEIHIPDTFNSTPTFRHCTDRTSECLVKNHFLSQVNHLQRQTQINLENTNAFIQQLVPEIDLMTNNGRKRGLLNFVSDIGQGLFGLARDSDVQTLARHINQLTRETNRVNQVLAQSGEHFSSYVAGVNHKLKTLTDEILLNKHGLEILRAQFRDTQEYYQRMFGTMTGIAMDQLAHYSDVHFQTDQLKFGIIDLVQGDLPPILIPPKILGKTLRDLQLLLDTQYNGYYVMNDDPHYYYKYSTFLLTRKGSSVFISLKIPISGYRYPFDVFSVTTVEVPMNSTSQHVTKLLRQPDYLLLSRDQTQYATLTSTEYSACTGTTFKHCTLRMTIKPVLTNPSCILSIFKNDVSSIQSLCDFRVLTNTLVPHIVELTNNRLLVYRLRTISLHCSDGSRQLDGCQDFCVITIPCKCSVDTDKVHFSGHISSCSENQTYTKVHPVNLALIQNFFNDSYIKSLTGDSFFNTTVNVSLPTFDLYEHKFSDLVADDKNNDLSLKKMAQAAKSDKQIFTSLAHSMVAGEVSLPPSWSDKYNIILIITGSMMIINFLITLWLIFKFRTLRAAVLFHRVSATLPPTFIYETIPTIPTPSVIETLQSSISWDHMIFLLAILNLFCILYFGSRYFTPPQRQTNVVIEVATQSTCVMLNVIQLPMCPSFYVARFPTDTIDIRVYGYLRPSLHISWSDFQIHSVKDMKDVHMPRKLKVGLITAWRLRHLIRSGNPSIYLYISHQGLIQPLPSNVEMTSVARPLMATDSS